MTILFHILANSLGILVAERFIPGVNFEGSIFALLFAGVILGVLNGILKPVLKIVAFPLMILTFGTFSFVISLFMIWLAVLLIPGFDISGITALILTTILLSVINTVVSVFK